MNWKGNTNLQLKFPSPFSDLHKQKRISKAIKSKHPTANCKYTSQPKGVVKPKPKPKPIPFDSQVKTALNSGRVFVFGAHRFVCREGMNVGPLPTTCPVSVQVLSLILLCGVFLGLNGQTPRPEAKSLL